ncbi:hypothetical protein DNTS_032837, partial [Danionella cerebrum]
LYRLTVSCRVRATSFIPLQPGASSSSLSPSLGNTEEQSHGGNQRAPVKTDSRQTHFCSLLNIWFDHHYPDTMNISLENPYGDVTIPRAKLRDQPNSSTIIMNPMALESAYNSRTSALNPYNSFRTPEENNTSSVPVYGENHNGHNPPPYNSQPTYVVKESEEPVGRCYACCCRCRRKK